MKRRPVDRYWWNTDTDTKRVRIFGPLLGPEGALMDELPMTRFINAVYRHAYSVGFRAATRSTR